MTALSQVTFAFLQDLSRNNHREWFHEHKARYDVAASDMQKFTAHLLTHIGEIDEEMAKTLSVKDCLFRIYRDTRFSTDKTPYKLNMSAYFCRGGKKSPLAGYYLHIQPDASFMAGGCWMPPAPMLQRIRQEIDYNGEELEQIIGHPDFRRSFSGIEGERLAKNPKGYAADHPQIELLRFKSFVVSHPLSNDTLLSEQAASQVLSLMKAMRPFVNFLNRALAE
jgi:uncharacterized protein (TIGR02453 family)